MSTIKLTVLTSEKGLYVANNARDYYGSRKSIASSQFLINGTESQSTFKEGWVFVPGQSELESIKIQGPKQRINYRWELKEDTPDEVKKLVPAVIPSEESDEKYDPDYGWSLGVYEGYQGFYNRAFDYIDGEFAEADFEVIHEGKISEALLSFPGPSTYKVWKTQYKHEGDKILDISQVATYEELNEMLTPDLLLHNTPCSLTSKQTYDIVRRYVLENIDKRWAAVTSDYEFCFTVKKKYEIKPYVHTWEEKKGNGKSYRRPRIHRKTITHKEFTIFEMTHAGSNYQGYTVIKGFSGDTLADLIEGIKDYLDNLMSVINEPLYECECCGGSGIVKSKNGKTMLAK